MGSLCSTPQASSPDGKYKAGKKRASQMTEDEKRDETREKAKKDAMRATAKVHCTLLAECRRYPH